jgi:hypothetical protein
MTMLSLSAEPYSQCRLLCILLYLNRSVKESGKIEYSYQLGGKEATYTQERGDQTTPASNVLNAKRCSAREECMEATFLASPGHILQLLLDVGGDINYSTIVLPYHIIFNLMLTSTVTRKELHHAWTSAAGSQDREHKRRSI